MSALPGTYQRNKRTQPVENNMEDTTKAGSVIDFSTGLEAMKLG